MRKIKFALGLFAACIVFASCGTDENRPGHEPGEQESIKSLPEVSSDTTFAALETLIGHKAGDVRLFERIPLDRHLDEVLKEDKSRLRQVLYSAGEIKKDKVLYLWGDVPEGMGGGFAYLLIDTEAEKVMGGIITAEKKVKLMKKGETLYQPQEIKEKCIALGWDGY